MGLGYGHTGRKNIISIWDILLPTNLCNLNKVYSVLNIRISSSNVSPYVLGTHLLIVSANSDCSMYGFMLAQKALYFILNCLDVKHEKLLVIVTRKQHADTLGILVSSPQFSPGIRSPRNWVLN